MQRRIKVCTKILTNQFQSVISSLVGDHQTCGIRGRTIQTNTHIARGVLDGCLMDRDRVAMLQIYLEKGFVHLRHDVLFSILEHVGIVNVIFRGMKISYNFV